MLSLQCGSRQLCARNEPELTQQKKSHLGPIESSKSAQGRNVGLSYTRPGSIELPKVLNQQFRKHSDLARGVVPRRSDNEDSDFGERISIHER